MEQSQYEYRDDNVCVCFMLHEHAPRLQLLLQLLDLALQFFYLMLAFLLLVLVRLGRDARVKAAALEAM